MSLSILTIFNSRSVIICSTFVHQLKTTHMKTVSTILRYVVAIIVIFAILSYCQELNDCLAKY